MPKRICKFCGNSFLTSTSKRYCSNECSSKFYSQKNKKTSPELKEFQKRKCSFCSERAVGLINSKLVCSFHFKQERLRLREDRRK